MGINPLGSNVSQKDTLSNRELNRNSFTNMKEKKPIESQVYYWIDIDVCVWGEILSYQWKRMLQQCTHVDTKNNRLYFCYVVVWT